MAGEVIQDDDYLDMQVEIKLLSAFTQARDSKALRAQIVHPLRLVRDYKMQMTSNWLRSVSVCAGAVLSGK